MYIKQSMKRKHDTTTNIKHAESRVPDFKCWRAAVNSFYEKLSEIFIASGVVVLQRSDTS